MKYKREYVKISMRIQRMPPEGNEDKLRALITYREELKRKRDQLIHGTITDQEFISWVDAFKEGRKV